MNYAEQRTEDLEWLRAEADGAALEAVDHETNGRVREKVSLRGADPNRVARAWRIQEAHLRRIIGYIEQHERLEGMLDYVASCFHMAMHGIKDAPTWQECDRQPCRSANGRLPSVRQVDASESKPS